MLQKKRPQCAATRTDGERCTSWTITAEGAVRLLDRGIALQANPTDFCSWHCRTPEEQKRMSVKGGSVSPKQRLREQREARELPRKPLPDEIAVTAYQLIRSLLASTLPNVFPVEPDMRRRALGVYLALVMFDPGDRGAFIASLLPGHQNVEELAQQELRDVIFGLDHTQQKQAWEMIATAS